MSANHPIKKSFSRAALSAALFAALGALSAPSLAQGNLEFAPGRILVMPKAGLPEAALTKILEQDGGGVQTKRVGKSELRIVEMRPGAEQKLVERLSRHPHIKFAELDMRGKLALVPTDPYFGSQWHLNKVRAPEAWDSATGVGVTVAMLDTGVDCTHPDLVAVCVPGWNFVNNNSNTADDVGHGTLTAGVVAASLDNAIGVAGIAGRAKIMPLKIGSSTGFYYSDVASGLTYAADRGVRVANMSIYGALGSSAILNAAQYMKSKGGLVITSAGNNATDPGWADSPYIIAVSATDQNDALAGWSNFGRYISMTAPGVGIWTTSVGAGYSAPSGTSVASPVVAGVVALMMAANSNLSNLDVERLLYSTAVDLGASGRDSQFGYGRVDAGAGVLAALRATTTVDTTRPVAVIAAPLDGSTVSGLVPVQVSATDNVGVVKVQLYANGSLIASDTTTPYAFTFDSTRFPNGISNLSALAYDAAGNVGASAAVSVNVNNLAAVPDTTAPTVSLGNPREGDVVRGKVTVSVAGTDNSGAVALRLSLFINGQKRAEGLGGTLNYNWNTTKESSKSFIVRVTAQDAAGNLTAKSVSVTK